MLPICIGGVAGGVVGFLARPSVPLVGQLPFATVITRGGSLTGLDVLLKGVAETSFNYLLVGVVVGAAVGWFIQQQSAKKENG